MAITTETWPAAAEVLARGGTITEAAKAAKVERHTVARWRDDEPLFADAIRDGRAEMVDRASGVLSEATARAAAVLSEIFEDAGVAPQFRQSAAKSVLELASRYRADVALEERIRTLEMAAGLRGREPV